jgi:hypothetical protein
MTLRMVRGLKRTSRHGDSRLRTPGKRAGAILLGIAMLALVGCSTPLPPSTSGGPSDSSGTRTPRPTATPTPSSPSDATAGPGTTDPALTDDIPPGRSFAEGGGGPLSYTFRDEWRKARAAAQTWRSGAYLISAAGDFINDDGVPSHWSMNFIDQANADAVLLIEIDAWGKVTQTRTVTGGGVSSFVGQYTKRIPYAIIDSDKAVGLGKAALAAKYDLNKTKDPRIGLNFSEIDGTGPYWTFTLFNNSTANYITARIDALTGAATLPS